MIPLIVSLGMAALWGLMILGLCAGPPPPRRPAVPLAPDRLDQLTAEACARYPAEVPERRLEGLLIWA